MLNWTDLNEIKSFLNSELTNIFKVYGNEIEIKAEDLNLLKSNNSVIRSSTSLGYILEEFVYQKLKNVLKNNKNRVISRPKIGTQKSSFDFIISQKQYSLLINVKTENEVNSGQNNAVAAIKMLYNDYSRYMKSREKDFYFIVLKILYKINEKPAKIEQKITKYYDKINVGKIKIYALEEISFKDGHKQDNRSWSTVYNKTSGRLLINNNFLNKYKLKENDELSNEKTLDYIEKMMNS